MYEDDDEAGERGDEKAADPASRAKEQADTCRMHAEMAAVYEGPRKFDARLIPTLDAEVARQVQRGVARLEKARTPDVPVLPPETTAEAEALLGLFAEKGLNANDYHIHRRPGEVMVCRWIEGAQVETYYQRIQAHFDVALEQAREDERQSLGWKADGATRKYLDLLDELELKMASRYCRDLIRQHAVAVLSTRTIDQLNVAYLTDYIMGVRTAELVGRTSAPKDAGEGGEGADESELSWFFKLFALRGMHGGPEANGGVERMLFFTYLQKADDAW